MISSIFASAGGDRPDMRRQSIRPRSPLDNISPGVLVFLTSLTVLTTGLAAVQYLTPDSDFSMGVLQRVTVSEDSAPFLGQIRTSEGKTFTRGNIAKAPWLYGIGHILPAALWTFFIPLQHSAYLRNRYRALHRILGRVILISALPLAITPMFFKAKGVFYTHEDALHLHRPFTSLAAHASTPSTLRPLLKAVVWPTSEVFSWVISPFLLCTAYKTIVTARSRRIAEHKKWATMHTLVGLTIHIERFTLVICGQIGMIVASMSSEEFRAALGVPERQDFAKGEMAAFAVSLWAAAAITVPWAWQAWRQLDATHAPSASGKRD